MILNPNILLRKTVKTYLKLYTCGGVVYITFSRKREKVSHSVVIFFLHCNILCRIIILSRTGYNFMYLKKKKKNPQKGKTTGNVRM